MTNRCRPLWPDAWTTSRPLQKVKEGERKVLEALNRHGVPFMLVGLSAAVLQGANTATRDIDLWFEAVLAARLLSTS